MAGNSFQKGERLKKRKLIDTVFKKGKSSVVYPLRVVWVDSTEDFLFPAQMGAGVSKRKFPKAVDRNQVKRLIKEAYRLEKKDFYEVLNKKGMKFALMILYIGDKHVSFDKIEASMSRLLKKIK